MLNPYQTRTAKIIKITEQTPGIKLFSFDFKILHAPGQIIILSLPGFGEAPFAPCNKPGGNLQLCVRNVGRLTSKLHLLKVGDKVGIRGPYGNGWPAGISSSPQVRGGLRRGADQGNPNTTSPSPSSTEEGRNKKNLLIVVGGLGLIPLRTLILGKDKFLGRDAIMQIFYGAKTPQEFLFRNEFESWRKNGIDLQLTVDNKCEGWNQCVGLVTTLFDTRNVVSDAKAFLCGPPIMYKFALQKVKEKRFKDEDIYLSLERRMHCGIGVCQHCAVGPYYTCKNGPVFNYDKIKNVVGVI